MCSQQDCHFPPWFWQKLKPYLLSQGLPGWGSLWPGSVPLRVGGGSEAHRPCFTFPLQLQYPICSICSIPLPILLVPLSPLPRVPCPAP